MIPTYHQTYAVLLCRFRREIFGLPLVVYFRLLAFSVICSCFCVLVYMLYSP